MTISFDDVTKIITDYHLHTQHLSEMEEDLRAFKKTISDIRYNLQSGIDDYLQSVTIAEGQQKIFELYWDFTNKPLAGAITQVAKNIFGTKYKIKPHGFRFTCNAKGHQFVK